MYNYDLKFMSGDKVKIKDTSKVNAGCEDTIWYAHIDRDGIQYQLYNLDITMKENELKLVERIPILFNHDPSKKLTDNEIKEILKEHDVKAFLQGHKEIQVDAYTSKQLEEMAEIDKKFKQLGEYSIHPFNDKLVIFLNNITMGKNLKSPDIYKPWFPAETIYDTYVGTFKQLKFAGLVFKYIDNCRGYVLKWDGKNFVPYVENKENAVNTNEVEDIVSKDIKETCLKSYNESLEKHAVSGDGAPAKNKVDIKIESDKSPENTAEEVKKAIDKYFKELGISFDNLQVNEKEKPSISIRNFFTDENLKNDVQKFQDKLIGYIDKKLDILAKITTHRTVDEGIAIEEAKKDIDTLTELRDKINVEVEKFMNITESEIINTLNTVSIINHYVDLHSLRRLKIEIA